VLENSAVRHRNPGGPTAAIRVAELQSIPAAISMGPRSPEAQTDRASSIRLLNDLMFQRRKGAFDEGAFFGL
jgi:hypothetical protein